MERDEREKRLREEQKKEEFERKWREKEEARKEEARRRQEAQLAKQQEAELRKQQEEAERQLKQRQLVRTMLLWRSSSHSSLQEEAQRRKAEELERERLEQQRIQAMILQHNSSLQQKAMANSFMKKTAPTTTITSSSKLLVDPEVSQKTTTIEKVADEGNSLAATANATFTMPKPVVKPPAVESYDISDLKSDDSDDETQPRKVIPSWAKGGDFLKGLEHQYGVPRKQRERQMRKIFPEVQLPVDLGKIFKGNKIVSSRYEKRTSSAVWTCPPAHLANLSMSFNTSKLADPNASLI